MSTYVTRALRSMPWLDAAGRFSPLKTATLVLVCLPALWMMGEFTSGRWDFPSPYVGLIYHSGLWATYLLLVGHNAPGGGFAGGLVAGMALVARYLAGGRHELGAAAPFDAGKLLGTGLVLAVGTALVPLFFGADALTSTWWELNLGIFGELEFVTSTIFDIGVYLVVIGLVLDVLRSLGAEVDRQQEQSEVSSS